MIDFPSHCGNMVSHIIRIISYALALGSLGFPVYHALYAVLFRCVYSGFATL